MKTSIEMNGPYLKGICGLLNVQYLDKVSVRVHDHFFEQLNCTWGRGQQERGE